MPARTRIHPTGQPSAPGAHPGRRPFLPCEPGNSGREAKVYLLVRADLSAGAQMTQVAHALSCLAEHDRKAWQTWRQDSDSLIVVQVDGEAELLEMAEQASQRGISHACWRERDWADEMTAIVLAPSAASAELTRGLTLAGHGEPAARARARESALRRLSESMEACEQTAGMSMLEHGRAVRETYLAVLDLADGRAPVAQESGWRLPSWLVSRGPELVASQAPRWVAERYLTLHDCGKADVRMEGEDGRVRFPDHARASGRRYAKTLGPWADARVRELIERDMDVHTLNGQGMSDLARHWGSATLLLAAVAEVHANSTMFGGVDSDAFKAKCKRVEARGRALIRAWDEHGWPDGQPA